MVDSATLTPRHAAPSRPAALLAGSEDRQFRELVVSHRKALQAFVVRKIGNATDAEDLTQQAFIEAARSMATFKGESALSTWLYGIAMNLVRNHLSRAPHRKYRFEDDSALAEVSSDAPTPQRRLEQAQLLAVLDSELAQLSPDMREVLMLVAVDELSYEEAATLLTVPIGTVRSRVSRARQLLRAGFVKAGIDSPV